MSLSRIQALVVVLVIALHAPRVWAQAWLADRSRTEGMGLRVGDLELHPGVGAEFGYDSNYFQRAGADAGARAATATSGLSGAQLQVLQETTAARERVVPLLRLRAIPHISLSTLGPQRSAIESGEAAPPSLKFRANAALIYSEYFPVETFGADRTRQWRNLQGSIGGQLDIKPYGPFGADLEAQYVRSVEPSNSLATSNAFNRSTVDGGGGVVWRPGGGLFRWRLGYRARAFIFERATFSDLGNVQHTMSSNGRWLFLPRTALLSQSEITLVRYGAGNVSQNDGDLVRTMLGINGLVTYHFGFLALAGWGASFYQPSKVPAENYDGPIGQAEAVWYPTPQKKLQEQGAAVGVSSIAGGYTRDFANSYFGDYYQRDRVYARIGYAFGGGVFVLTGSAGYSFVTRPDIHFPPSDLRNGGTVPGYTANRIDSMVFGEYRVTDSIGINLTFRYDANLTHVLVQNSTDPSQGIDDLGFSRYQVFLGARWFL